MQDTKITFSENELQALDNTEFFVIKRSIEEKIKKIFLELRDDYHQTLTKIPGILPDEKYLSSGGKVFRGENYRMFPYIVLDYPRHFSKEEVFAFRTMMWWGHHFSFTLHIGEAAMEKYGTGIIARLPQLRNTGTYICVNDTPWHYHYEPSNYSLLDELSDTEIQKIGRQYTFIKLSRKMPVIEWEKIKPFGTETLRLFFGLLI